MAKRLRLASWKTRARQKKQEEAKAAKKSKPWIEYLGAETREQISIIEELLLHPWFKDIDWEHYPAEGKRDAFNAWLFTKMGGKSNIPDFRIHELRGGYNGLWMEYKKTGTKLFKADGTPYADIKEQWDYLLRMQEKMNVKIAIVESPEKAIQTIKDYLHLPKNG